MLCILPQLNGPIDQIRHTSACSSVTPPFFEFIITTLASPLPPMPSHCNTPAWTQIATPSPILSHTQQPPSCIRVIINPAAPVTEQSTPCTYGFSCSQYKLWPVSVGSHVLCRTARFGCNYRRVRNKLGGVGEKSVRNNDNCWLNTLMVCS